MSKFGRRGRIPDGFEILEPTLEALENEMRERVNESHEGYRKNESLWPVHQINWQRTRYVYDMHYKYGRVTREVYDYCVRNRIIDGALAAKWKKPGYERLCSTYVINSRNYKFGTVSICRVPKYKLPPGTVVEDVTTGCQGCASGRGGSRNIFGSKYGQYLADVQVARELKLEKQMEEEDDAVLPPGMSGPPPPDGDDSDSDDAEDADDAGPQPQAEAEKKPAREGMPPPASIPKASGFAPVADDDSDEEAEKKKNAVWAANEAEVQQLKDVLVNAEFDDGEGDTGDAEAGGENRREADAALRALKRGGTGAFEAKEGAGGGASGGRGAPPSKRQKRR